MPLADRPRPDGPARLVAHRGASRAAPENTLPAFDAAARTGARWVEFDVSLLGDGTPVLCHDATLDRCTDATGPLSAIGRADLAGIDAGAWFGPAFAGTRMPTLDAALDHLGAAGLSGNLEMKPQDADPGPLAAAVAQALAARPWTRTRLTVSSFEAGALDAFRTLDRETPVALLYGHPPEDWPERAEALAAEGMHVVRPALDADLRAAALAEGVALRVYTVNDLAELRDQRGPGLDAVITDDPALFLTDADWAAWAAA